MEIPCPHCRQTIEIPEARRSWVPFVVLGLLGAFVLLMLGGFMLIAGLTFPALSRAQSAVAAERMAVEAAREQEMAARMLAEENLARARAAREEGRDDLQGFSKRQREEMEARVRQQKELLDVLQGVFVDPGDPAKTRERLDEARERLKEMEKRLREEK